ncbi:MULTISPECIES: phosphatase PAP2 family protein [Rufibacter]|uniref:Membrane-associated phospholipid phosphatase n=1 Tax=Rufibacter quisquiliarum TaxID=1549639 RepID=A0A839GQT5_9BACT|nr:MULTISPECIES: phosphatase PAP2 family protein [Rufibacter]MBA9076201.1 membrane-associated phospholipid phosphatase [Rufibacter quisquiliarum]
MTQIPTFNLLESLRHLALVPCLWFALLPAPALAQVTSDTLQTTVTLTEPDTTKAGVPVSTLDPALQKGALRKRLIAPAIFVGVGLLMIDNGLYDRQDFRYDFRTKPFPNFKSDVDDFLIFAPAAGLLVFDIFSSQNRHDVTRQVGLLAGSAALASALLWPLKKVTAVPRPNEENSYSFPSGHTTYAFVVATMVSREFRGKSKWIGIASYTTAGVTGMMRVLNDAHWFSDVLAGAGVGILSTNLVYLAHDRWFKNRGFNAQVVPTVMFNGTPGVAMVIPLN